MDQTKCLMVLKQIVAKIRLFVEINKTHTNHVAMKGMGLYLIGTICHFTIIFLPLWMYTPCYRRWTRCLQSLL